MVVQFARDVAPLSADERHPVKKKYLISRTREHQNSIFDYVHLSSSLLRKVRYGQSLDAALQTRSPWNGEAAVSPPAVSRPSRAPCPLSIWRNLDGAQHHAQSPRRRVVGSFNPRSDKTHAHEGTIRYGRPIQLQATDGGFLAVDADGCLVKLPSSHREDPSTLLTLFPQNPLLAPRSKSHVLCGELCFLVVGSATIQTNHDVQYADSKRTYGPPAALCNAVVCHQLQHGNLSRPREQIRDNQSSTVWCFRRTTTMTPTGTRPEVLETGMLVQLRQRDWTMHYETERIAKKKYTPITTTTTELSGPEAEDSPPVESSRSAPFTHVWLQQNDLSSQHHDPKLTSAKAAHHWDNLWFLIDVASDRESERRRKQQDAVREAERDAPLRITDDPEDRDDERGHNKCQNRVEPLAGGVSGNNHEDDASQHVAKRVSVLHARVFVSHKAEQVQHHAAAIVVRFLRRVFRREAERRAKELIDRRIIRRTNKHLPQQHVDGCEPLTTHEQLRILQCFKPNIYGSQRAMMMESASHRIPGISLQGSKHTQLEAQRLVSMARDLKYLGSPEFKQVAVPRASSSSPSSNHQLSLPPPRQQLRAPHQQLSKERRDRDHKVHVQLAMVHREKPSFRFGKPTALQGRPQQLQHGHQYQLRPQTAPAFPVPKDLTGWKA